MRTSNECKSRLRPHSGPVLPQRGSVFAKPSSRDVVVRIRIGNELPVHARMVHAPQMHQLVNEHVIPYPRRHQNEPPIQADMTVTPAGTPTGTLIPDAHTRDVESMACRKLVETRRELDHRPFSQGQLLENT